MEKVVEFYNENKKRIGITAVIIVLIIAIFCIIGLFANDKKVNNKEELINMLSNMGAAYYEEFYWVQVGSDEKARAEFVKAYKETGVSTTVANMVLSNIDKVKDNIGELKNGLTGEECDLTKSKVKFIPEEPFGKTDYKLEVKLVCGFEEEK